MRFCVVRAGSMGSLYGGLLARGGFDVTLVDMWQVEFRTDTAHQLIGELTGYAPNKANCPRGQPVTS
jgi:ketopantoate reductase